MNKIDDILTLRTTNATFANICFLKYLSALNFDLDKDKPMLDETYGIISRLSKSEYNSMKFANIKIGFSIGTGGTSNDSYVELTKESDGLPYNAEVKLTASAIRDLYVDNWISSEYCNDQKEKFVKNVIPLSYSETPNDDYCLNTVLKDSDGNSFIRHDGKIAYLEKNIDTNSKGNTPIVHHIIECVLTKDEIIAKSPIDDVIINSNESFNEISLFIGERFSENGKIDMKNIIPFFKMTFSPVNVNDIPDAGIKFVFDLSTDQFE